VAERQCGELFDSAAEEPNDEPAGAQLDQGREGPPTMADYISA
jgi:hypothetical protein